MITFPFRRVVEWAEAQGADRTAAELFALERWHEALFGPRCRGDPLGESNDKPKMSHVGQNVQDMKKAPKRSAKPPRGKDLSLPARRAGKLAAAGVLPARHGAVSGVDWRRELPAAVAEEPWSPPSPLVLTGRMPDGAEHFECDRYNVTRRYAEDTVFRSGEMVVLGISAADGTARHDWRDFQWIKNELVGPETEAFELYPAESRKLDPSNYYLLWCFPRLNRIRVGPDAVRRVLTADEAPADAPQRGFAEEAACT